MNLVREKTGSQGSGLGPKKENTFSNVAELELQS